MGREGGQVSEESAANDRERRRRRRRRGEEGDDDSDDDKAERTRAWGEGPCARGEAVGVARGAVWALDAT